MVLTEGVLHIMFLTRLTNVVAILLLGSAWISPLSRAVDAKSDPPKTAEKGKEITLPKDPRAAVIVLDWVGGFTPPRKNKEPYLTIRADGSVFVNDPFGFKPNIETKLTPKELQDLLRFALVENDFFGFDSAKVSAAVKAEQAKKGVIGPVIADAPTTVIRIHANGKEHEARYYALGSAADSYPTVKQLRQLRNIEQRLHALMQTADKKK